MPRKKKLEADDRRLAQVVREQFTFFVDRFGREPTLDDPLFFCWHSAAPVTMCELCLAEYEHGIVEAANKAGVDPARALEAGGVDDPFGTLKTTN